MKLEHIRLFLAVVQSGSISQAAKAGFITQQGLSLALKQIESELGISLFNRSNKGVELTDEGEKFYQCSRSMLRLYDDFLFDLHDDGCNNVFNLYISNNMYKMLPFLNEAPFAKRNGWYFSYVERSAEAVIHMINDHKGVGIFSVHGASEAGLLDKVSKELRLYDVGSEDKIVYICHQNSDLAKCAAEARGDAMDKLKCIISSSEHDLNYPAESVRKTICSPDLYSHKQLMKARDTFSIVSYNMYKMYFEPTEYLIVGERKLKTVIKYYAAFNLKANTGNLQLEQMMIKYLREMFDSI